MAEHIAKHKVLLSMSGGRVLASIPCMRGVSTASKYWYVRRGEVPWNVPSLGLFEALVILSACPNSKVEGGSMGELSFKPLYLEFAVGLLRTCGDVDVVTDETVANLLDEPARVAAEPLDLSLFEGELMPHQEQAVRWMRARTRDGSGLGIIADEMGLGKTVEAIAFLCDLAARLGGLRALVVCPASVMSGWVGHFHKHAPSLDVALVKGRQDERRKTIEATPCNVLVTSYGCLRRDGGIYEKTEYDCVVFDEVHALKGWETKSHRAACRVRAPRKFGLSGTPTPNSSEELAAEIECLGGGSLVVGKSWFMQFFGRPIERGDECARQTLECLLAPCVLRRLKEDVLKLPNKCEHVVTIELTAAEMFAYRKMETGLAHMVNSMTDEEFERNRVGIFGRITKLRQLATSMLAVDTSFPCVPSKIATATKLVRKLVDEGHRVVVHTLLVEGVVGPLVCELGLRGIRSAVLTGSVPTASRQGIIDGFVNGVVQVLVISAAGTEGVNLQRGADREVLLTPWWNYAVTSQAIDRIHRLGQESEVEVFRMVSANTIEERMLVLEERKLRETSAIIVQQERHSSRLTRNELLELLGVHDVS